jgi:hypothetical protein
MMENAHQESQVDHVWCMEDMKLVLSGRAVYAAGADGGRQISGAVRADSGRADSGRADSGRAWPGRFTLHPLAQRRAGATSAQHVHVHRVNFRLFGAAAPAFHRI